MSNKLNTRKCLTGSDIIQHWILLFTRTIRVETTECVGQSLNPFSDREGHTRARDQSLNNLSDERGTYNHRPVRARLSPSDS